MAIFHSVRERRSSEAGRMEPRRHLHVGENRFFKSAALAPSHPAPQTQPPRPLLPMGIVRISVRPDFVSRATDEFRELNFLMLTVGRAKSASGAPARCLHQFSRLDIFTMRRGVSTPALAENIGESALRVPAVPLITKNPSCLVAGAKLRDPGRTQTIIRQRSETRLPERGSALVSGLREYFQRARSFRFFEIDTFLFPFVNRLPGASKKKRLSQPRFLL